MLVTNSLIQSFFEGYSNVYISDYKTFKSLRGSAHLRGGKITKEHSKVLAGQEVHAIGYDPVGNLYFLDTDGYTRSWFESDEIKRVRDNKITKWLRANPEVGFLNRVGAPDNQAYYYHDENRTYIEIEAFGTIPEASKWTFIKEVKS